MISLFLVLIAGTMPVNTAFCGYSSIPYSLEVLPSGDTVLGCARPSCFGWNPDTGLPMSSDPSFAKVNGHADGFFRQGPTSRQPFDVKDSRVYNQQVAECNFSPAASCGPNQWVAGIEPNNNPWSFQASVQCCTIPALSASDNRGVASVKKGQIVIGGEVMQNGVQTHFDYISNLRKVRYDGSIIHEVTIKRMPCQEIPTYAPQPKPVVRQYYKPVVRQYYKPRTTCCPTCCYCFSADTKVRLIDGSEKRMDELAKRDWIQTVTNENSTYEPVLYWLHRVPSQKAEFIKFTLSDGNELKMTRSHFVYKTSCDEQKEEELEFTDLSPRAVPAEEVNQGDCLYTVPVSGRPIATRVLNITIVKEMGIYSPMTGNGKIVVNGIYASCHSVVESHVLQNTFFKMIDRLHEKMIRYFVSDSKNHERLLPYSMDTVVEMMSLLIPDSLLGS